MSNTVTFSRTTDGAVNLADSTLKAAYEFARPLGLTATISPELNDAASARLVEMAQEVAFLNKRTFREAVEYVGARNPELFLLSRLHTPTSGGKPDLDVEARRA